ncbi:hypothetical protein D3C71_2022040 [compost metagenome]
MFGRQLAVTGGTDQLDRTFHRLLAKNHLQVLRLLRGTQFVFFKRRVDFLQNTGNRQHVAFVVLGFYPQL